MTQKAEPLSSSLEDYLEAIYCIVREKKAARSKDISRRLGVNSSSVTGALHLLSSRELINYAPYDIVTLTDKGESLASGIFKRHTVLQEFFATVLGVHPAEAEDSACRMEHSVSPLILDRLTQFVQFMKSCPRATIRWIPSLGYFCDHPESPEDCERCIKERLEELQNLGGGKETGSR